MRLLIGIAALVFCSGGNSFWFGQVRRFHLLTLVMVLASCAATSVGNSGGTKECRFVTNPDGSVRQMICS